MPRITRHIESQICCDPEWEAAYRRFESPEQEIEKFLRRYREFGFQELPRDSAIAEIFCGRGGGLVALARMNFTNLQGVDLSEQLLLQYEGEADLHLADCRELPQTDQSLDAVVVHGGLHHLPTLPEDLVSVANEVRRVLKPTGRFYVNEPWATPFLHLVHFVTHRPIVRRFWRRGAAFWEMVERERVTYENWLAQPQQVLSVLADAFDIEHQSIGGGKLKWIGRPKPTTTRDDA